MRASASLTTAAALALPDTTDAAISLAVIQDVSSGTGLGFKDGRRLDIVRQFEFGDQRRVIERNFEIGSHRQQPVGFHRQAKRPRRSGNEIVEWVGIGHAHCPLQWWVRDSCQQVAGINSLWRDQNLLG